MTGSNAGRGEGSWLFKQGDLLMGPVSFQKLVHMLLEGEVDENTRVAPQSGDRQFRPVREVEAFKVHLAKAQARRRVEAQSCERDRRARSRRTIKLSVLSVVMLAALFGGGRLAFWLAIHRPWEKQIQIPEPTITDEMPSIKLASARAEEEELVYPDAKGLSGSAKTKHPRSDKRPGRGAIAGAQSGLGSKQAGGGEDDVQSLQLWDQEAINAVLRANKANLHPCLAQEAKRQRGDWEARVPIEFTIGNEGRITKLWIDNPEYKDEGSELHKCMMAELRKWRFPAYAGEQANVSLAFQIKAR
jgi:hypothetical protein